MACDSIPPAARCINLCNASRSGLGAPFSVGQIGIKTTPNGAPDFAVNTIVENSRLGSCSICSFQNAGTFNWRLP
jgi:hypothetical protein